MQGSVSEVQPVNPAGQELLTAARRMDNRALTMEGGLGGGRGGEGGGGGGEGQGEPRFVPEYETLPVRAVGMVPHISALLLTTSCVRAVAHGSGRVPLKLFRLTRRVCSLDKACHSAGNEPDNAGLEFRDMVVKAVSVDHDPGSVPLKAFDEKSRVCKYLSRLTPAGRPPVSDFRGRLREMI